MNVHSDDTKASVEAPAEEESEEGAEEGAESAFMEIRAQNWTTYSTTFKPSQEERQAKQDAASEQDVKNLLTV